MRTVNEVGATQIWRNDRFWLAADHIVDPRIEHLPKVKALIEKSEKAQKDFKLTDYMGKNVRSVLHNFHNYTNVVSFVMLSTPSSTQNSFVKELNPECSWLVPTHTLVPPEPLGVLESD